jgi:DNA uptake protein ComE-like DNA-binding protein
MFKFSKAHYPGIVVLFILIGVMQFGIYWFKNNSNNQTIALSESERKWLSSQNEIDSLKERNQENVNKIFPFNPNFISDYKGYKLGMSVNQIDKLHRFRKQNKYVNSNQEFQKRTGVSDQWMKQYSKYFKFPDWVNNKSKSTFQAYPENKYQNFDKKEAKFITRDINTANQIELEAVYMIGEKTAQKIISEREKLGGFVSMQQLEWIWGLSPEALPDLNKKFQVKSITTIKKLKINQSTIKELQQLPYFNYYLAKNIVTYRSMNDRINNIEDLTKIKGFPVDKIKIIALYLEF